jgi:hypothetical protein
MELKPESLRIRPLDDDIEVSVEGKTIAVDRVVRAFPRSHPDAYISFLDHLGHEIGLIVSCKGMEAESKTALMDHLRQLYFIPTIEEILSVETTGTTSKWRVVTDDGDREFQVLGRESLDGEKPPRIQVTDSDARKYQIVNYWELDKESRLAIHELLPDRIVKSKLVARRSSGMVMRMR